MSKVQEKRAAVETYFGQPVVPAVKFEYTYVELGKGDEIPADEMPDAEDLLSFVNQKRNAKARSAAQAEAMDAAGWKKPTLESADVRFAQMVKILKAAGNTQDQAEQMAHQVLGV